MDQEVKLLAPYEYDSLSTYDKGDLRRWMAEKEREGWEMYQINMSRTSTFSSVAYKRQMQRDANGFTAHDFNREDEAKALEMIRQHTDGEAEGEQRLFAYPGVFEVIYDREWTTWIEETQKFKITDEGRKALASQK